MTTKQQFQDQHFTAGWTIEISQNKCRKGESAWTTAASKRVLSIVLSILSVTTDDTKPLPPHSRSLCRRCRRKYLPKTAVMQENGNWFADVNYLRKFEAYFERERKRKREGRVKEKERERRRERERPNRIHCYVSLYDTNVVLSRRLQKNAREKSHQCWRGERDIDPLIGFQVSVMLWLTRDGPPLICQA